MDMPFAQLRGKYAIAGIGYTPQGSVPGRSAVSFHVEASANAIADAGLHPHEVDGLLLYRHFDPVGGDVDVSAFLVAEQLGLRPFALSQETYCTRTWLTHAIGLLEMGFCSYVVVSYGDNARSGKRSFVKELSGGAASDELAAFGDLSTLAKYAILARRAMYEEGTGPHVWKEISLAQRAWANRNPIAAMHEKPLTDADYDVSAYVAEPFRLLDATPVSDGGRAIVLTSTARAKASGRPYAVIRGFGQANLPDSPYRLRVSGTPSAAEVSGRMAYEMAGITPKDVDACQLYDCFTYTVEVTLRDYGFFAPGQSSDWVRRERLGPGGELPVNTSGGMLSEGYFMGLTPVCEGAMQLMGRCGERQMGGAAGGKRPSVILCSDNGAVFQSHCTLVLEGGRTI